MDNPFYENGFLLPIASVNKLMVSKIDGIDDKNILNKYASDIFSSDLLSNEVRSFLISHEISFAQDNMFYIFKKCLINGDSGQIKTGKACEPAGTLFKDANRLLKRLGTNLACILLALYEGLDENRALRGDWDSRHWDYWRSIKKVILCGGFMQDIIGEMIVEYTKGFFEEINKRPYEILTAKDNLPLIGACKYGSKYSESSIAFDLGHSYIKRCYYSKNGSEFLIKPLASKKSKHLDLDEDPCWLDDYIFEIILKTFDELPSDISQGPVIPACIANYVRNGDIYVKRGNYSKLKKLADNYQKYLSGKLSERLGRDIEIVLLHDGSAAAYAVNEPDCAVLTLGTAIGVGFTRENFDFEYKFK